MVALLIAFHFQMRRDTIDYAGKLDRLTMNPLQPPLVLPKLIDELRQFFFVQRRFRRIGQFIFMVVLAGGASPADMLVLTRSAQGQDRPCFMRGGQGWPFSS